MKGRLWTRPANDNAPLTNNGPGGMVRLASAGNAALDLYADWQGETRPALAPNEARHAASARQLCPIRFQGQWEDAETGLCYNRLRTYDPLSAQYMSPDPIGVLGGLRSSGYVKLPQRQIDALGLASMSGVGPYGLMGGHDIHAQAAFKGNPAYDKNLAIAISQKYMKCKGWDHQKITNKQRELYNELARSGRGNTMLEQDWIAAQALMAGGANPAEAAMLTGLSRANLGAMGVTQPSGIPWN